MTFTVLPLSVPLLLLLPDVADLTALICVGGLAVGNPDGAWAGGDGDGGGRGGGGDAGGPLPTLAAIASASATDLSSTVTFCCGGFDFCWARRFHLSPSRPPVTVVAAEWVPLRGRWRRWMDADDDAMEGWEHALVLPLTQGCCCCSPAVMTSPDWRDTAFTATTAITWTAVHITTCRPNPIMTSSECHVTSCLQSHTCRTNAWGTRFTWLMKSTFSWISSMTKVGPSYLFNYNGRNIPFTLILLFPHFCFTGAAHSFWGWHGIIWTNASSWRQSLLLPWQRVSYVLEKTV